MKPQTAQRIAWFLIPLGLILAVFAAVQEDWIALAAMVILIVGQALNLWAIRRRREKERAVPNKQI